MKAILLLALLAFQLPAAARIEPSRADAAKTKAAKAAVEDAARAKAKAKADAEGAAAALPAGELTTPAQKQQSAHLIYAIVQRVLPDSIIVKGSIPPGIYANPNPQNRKMVEGRIAIIGYPKANQLADNDTLDCLVLPTGKTYKLGATTLKEYEYIGPKP